jgi:hypothetical protein
LRSGGRELVVERGLVLSDHPVLAAKVVPWREARRLILPVSLPVRLVVVRLLLFCQLKHFDGTDDRSEERLPRAVGRLGRLHHPGHRARQFPEVNNNARRWTGVSDLFTHDHAKRQHRLTVRPAIGTQYHQSVLRPGFVG